MTLMFTIVFLLLGLDGDLPTIAFGEDVSVAAVFLLICVAADIGGSAAKAAS